MKFVPFLLLAVAVFPASAQVLGPADSTLFVEGVEQPTETAGFEINSIVEVETEKALFAPPSEPTESEPTEVPSENSTTEETQGPPSAPPLPQVTTTQCEGGVCPAPDPSVGVSMDHVPQPQYIPPQSQSFYQPVTVLESQPVTYAQSYSFAPVQSQASVSRTSVRVRTVSGRSAFGSRVRSRRANRVSCRQSRRAFRSC